MHLISWLRTFLDQVGLRLKSTAVVPPVRDQRALRVTKTAVAVVTVVTLRLKLETKKVSRRSRGMVTIQVGGDGQPRWDHSTHAGAPDTRPPRRRRWSV